MIRVARSAGMICLLAASWAAAQPLQLVNAFPNLSFTKPLFLTHSGDGTNRLFVVQQTGLIRVFPNDSTTPSARVFLDVSGRLSSSAGEEGLLGLAFHPQFASNGYFYVNYTAPNPLRTVVSRFTVSSTNPDSADPSSGLTLLEFSQPYTNHNGGSMAFGPDGYLYIGTGDGGSGGDPQNNAQRLNTLLGKMLRIDVNTTASGKQYGIPPDNPFAGNPNDLPEIWAYGLRNPWRFSFDLTTGALWAGDVGQNAHEEIDILEKGKNYGWNVMEGRYCYNPPSGCDSTGLTMPVKDYGRDQGNSITGGYVYRGVNRPELTGSYIYADFVSRRIWKLRYESGTITEDALLVQAPFLVSSFGVDQNQELYVCLYDYSLTTGIYRFNRSSSVDVPRTQAGGMPAEFLLHQNFPNPFNPTTVVSYQLPVASEVRLTVHDVLGREVAVLVNEKRGAGRHEVKFDASRLGSGVYLYRLSAGDLVQTRKMVLTR